MCSDAIVMLTVDREADATCAVFIEAIGKHRHPARETDPPQV